MWKEEMTDEKDREDEGAECVNRAIKITMNNSAMWFIVVSALAQNHLSWLWETIVGHLLQHQVDRLAEITRIKPGN